MAVPHRITKADQILQQQCCRIALGIRQDTVHNFSGESVKGGRRQLWPIGIRLLRCGWWILNLRWGLFAGSLPGSRAGNFGMLC